MTLVDHHLERELAQQTFDRLRMLVDNEAAFRALDRLEAEYLHLLALLEEAEFRLTQAHVRKFGALA